MAPDIDNDRVARCRAGDAAAFRELFDGYASRVLGTARRITGNAHDAEDILQEVFLKVHRNLGSFAGRSTFSLWIHKISVHESLNWKRRRPALPDRPAESATDESAQLLAPLSPPLRAVMTLRYVSGFSYDEIADVMGIPVGTVKSRIFEAQEQLRPS